MAMYPYNNETHTRWDKGGFKVMIKSPQQSNPVGFCDGELEDEQAIRTQAMQEGTGVVIDKKDLKTGRQVWTVRAE